MNLKANGILKAVAFVAATMLATTILVVSGLGDDGQGPRVGWFEVSQN
jgi:hypothetical protein